MSRGAPLDCATCAWLTCMQSITVPPADHRYGFSYDPIDFYMASSEHPIGPG